MGRTDSSEEGWRRQIAGTSSTTTEGSPTLKGQVVNFQLNSCQEGMSTGADLGEALLQAEEGPLDIAVGAYAAAASVRAVVAPRSRRAGLPLRGLPAPRRAGRLRAAEDLREDGDFSTWGVVSAERLAAMKPCQERGVHERDGFLLTDGPPRDEDSHRLGIRGRLAPEGPHCAVLLAVSQEPVAQLVRHGRAGFHARRKRSTLQPDPKRRSIPHGNGLQLVADEEARRAGLRDAAGSVGDPHSLGRVSQVL